MISDLNIWSKIITNIIIMFSLTALIFSANRAGILEYLYKPLNRVTDSRIIIFSWFLISTFLSAFTLDVALALILIPIAVLYAEYRELNKTEILLAVTWGNMVGSEWTYFGGGDTLIGWTLLEKYLKRPLDIVTWIHLFWTPTFVALITTGMCLYIFIKKQTVSKKDVELPKLTLRTILTALLVILGIASIFYPKIQWYYTFGIAVLSSIAAKLTIEDIKKMPFKGIYIWVASILLGTVTSKVISAHYNFTFPSSISSITGIIVILISITVLHLFITSSGLTAVLLPLVMASQFTDKLWLFVLVTKAISLTYLTILSNSGLAVSSSYGLNQYEMFKKGLLVVIVQMAVFAIYFYLMRGQIMI